MDQRMVRKTLVSELQQVQRAAVVAGQAQSIDQAFGPDR